MKLRQARKLAKLRTTSRYPDVVEARRRKHKTWIGAAERLVRSVRRALNPQADEKIRTADRKAAGRTYDMAEVS